MPKRLFIAVVTVFFSLALLLPLVNTIKASDEFVPRTYTVQMTYVLKDNYKNRLANAQAAFNVLQAFFDQTSFRPKVNYSFLHDVLHGTLSTKQGFVGSPKGF